MWRSHVLPVSVRVRSGFPPQPPTVQRHACEVNLGLWKKLVTQEVERLQQEVDKAWNTK